MQAESERQSMTRPNSTADSDGTNVRAMAIATSLFFMWGFLTSLNDVMIPNLKAIFDLNFTRAMFVQFAFFCSYFIVAYPSGKLVERCGFKLTMVIGLLTMTAGALIFIPASKVPSYSLFLAGLVVLAAGITALQVAANPYVANLGPQRTASSRLDLAQAFNSLGTFLAPIVGGYLILARIPKSSALATLSGVALRAARMREAASVRLPYLGIALTLAGIGIALALVKLPAMDFTRDLSPNNPKAVADDRLREHPQLLMAALGIFLYVGAEVAIGSFLISYFQLPSIGNLSPRVASLYVSLYWGGAMVGRFIGSFILRRLPVGLVLGFAAAIACLLVVLSMLSNGHVAMAAIIAVGLFNSIMFPTIFSLGLANLGPLVGRGSSVMVAAIVGGAIIPLAQGKIADSSIGLHHAFVLPVMCYIYIAVFGFSRRDPPRERA